MLSAGNGDPIQCVGNLLSIVRGEVPYDRVKGLNARWIDGLQKETQPELIEDAKWLIKVYEPRVDADEIEIVATEATNGNYELKVYAKAAGGENIGG